VDILYTLQENINKKITINPKLFIKRLDEKKWIYAEEFNEVVITNIPSIKMAKIQGTRQTRWIALKQELNVYIPTYLLLSILIKNRCNASRVFKEKTKSKKPWKWHLFSTEVLLASKTKIYSLKLGRCKQQESCPFHQESNVTKPNTLRSTMWIFVHKRQRFKMVVKIIYWTLWTETDNYLFKHDIHNTVINLMKLDMVETKNGEDYKSECRFP
jgi:hypothetical protein